MTDILDMVRADAAAAEQRKAALRDRFPDLAAIRDSLGDAVQRMAVYDENGTLVAGREPPADPPSWVTLSGECVVALSNFGRTK
jgi:hypothetical protein